MLTPTSDVCFSFLIPLLKNFYELIFSLFLFAIKSFGLKTDIIGQFKFPWNHLHYFISHFKFKESSNCFFFFLIIIILMKSENFFFLNIPSRSYTWLLVFCFAVNMCVCVCVCASPEKFQTSPLHCQCHKITLNVFIV